MAFILFTSSFHKLICSLVLISDLVLLTADMPTLLGVASGIFVLAGLLCMVLHLYTRARFHPTHLADARLTPPALYSLNDTGESSKSKKSPQLGPCLLTSIIWQGNNRMKDYYTSVLNLLNISRLLNLSSNNKMHFDQVTIRRHFLKFRCYPVAGGTLSATRASSRASSRSGATSGTLDEPPGGRRDSRRGVPVSASRAGAARAAAILLISRHLRPLPRRGSNGGSGQHGGAHPLKCAAKGELDNVCAPNVICTSCGRGALPNAATVLSYSYSNLYSSFLIYLFKPVGAHL